MGSFAVLPLGDLAGAAGPPGEDRHPGLRARHGAEDLQLTGGAAVAAASNDPREYLGQLLINYGHLDRGAARQAFQVQEETKVRLGKVLTMVGLVASDIIREVLAIRDPRDPARRLPLGLRGLHLRRRAGGAGRRAGRAVPLTEIAREAEFRATAWSAFRGEFPTGAAPLMVVEERVPADLAPATVDGRLLAAGPRGEDHRRDGPRPPRHRLPPLPAALRPGAAGICGPLRGAPPVRTAGQPGAAAAQLLDRARGLLADGHADEAEVDCRPGAGPGAALRRRLRRAGRDRAAPRGSSGPTSWSRGWWRGGWSRRRPSPAKLSNVDKYLLSRCDGRRTVEELAQMAPLRELDVLKTMRRLADDGVVALE